jgi:hypothetical protein
MSPPPKQIAGFPNNVEFLRRICENEEFQQASIYCCISGFALSMSSCPECSVAWLWENEQFQQASALQTVPEFGL